MEKNNTRNVVFLGQPNCGKSTLFNSIAGLKAETSNFPGSSVKHTHSLVYVRDEVFNIIDLPGTYSLCPQDPAERVALSHLFSEKPDVVVNVIDSSTLSRGLELTIELLELGYPMIVVLNMFDLAERKGITIDAGKLAAILGVPVIPTVGLHGRGVKELLDTVVDMFDRPVRPKPPALSGDVEERVRELEEAIPPEFSVIGSRRFTAVKLIETGGFYCSCFLAEFQPELSRTLTDVSRELSAQRGMPAYEVIAAERHHLAMKLFEGTSKVVRGKHLTLESRLDWALLHPLLGYIILIVVFLGLFFLIFKVGGPLEGLLMTPVGKLRSLLASGLGNGFVFHMLDGLLQGLGGGLAVVLPYFLPLLFLMSILDDVGYTARAGFLLDSFMHKIGLHGKSVAPFILGFGCNVPAIMATRILESRRDRIITALLVPFIPCSARTTIILALVAFYLGPMYAFGFYIMNIVVVALLGFVISHFFKGPSPGLILEIPELRRPSLVSVGRKVWLQLFSFIKFAWPLLVAGSVVLSLLTWVGATPIINKALSPLVRFGLGLPQELGVTLVFGFLRRELSLIMMLQALGTDYHDLLAVITREQIMVFTVFINFFIPCFSTLAIMWKEIGKKWALISVGLSMGVAMVLAVIARLVF